MSLQGKQLGRYGLEKLLGTGGMGEVYLADDTLIHRQVAIKVIRSEPAAYPDKESTKEASRLFQREVKAIAALDHPHILPLFDYGEEKTDGTILTYMVMPLRQEGTLATWLHDRGQSGLLSPLDVETILFQAASALQYAHDRQIIHQDVKPSNFLMRRDDQNPNLPYLLLSDFGVARFTSTTTGVSQSIRGTPIYMAPEQWEGHSVPATDQYALAVMAYELLAGSPPFQGGLTQMMYQHINVAPQPPSALNPYLSKEIDQVLLIALAKNPAGRFHSVMAFANALHNAIQLLDSTVLRSIQRMPIPQNVYATLAISQDEAQRGSSRQLMLSDGRRISVSIPAGTQNGQMLYLDSQGRLSVSPEKEGAIILSVAVMPDSKPDAGMLNEPTILQPPPPPSGGSFAPTERVSGDNYHLPSGGHYVPVGNAGRAGELPPTYYAPPAPDAASRRPSPTLTILLVVLAILVVSGGVLYLLRPLLLGNNINANANSTTVSSHTATVPATATATQANLSPSPTGSLGTTDPYAQNTSLVLTDPLVDNSHGNGWMEGTNSLGATCRFNGSVYQSLEPNSGYFHACMAKANVYSNFVFEVRATLVSGDYEGIVFRVNPNDTNQYYFFGIYTTGQYYLKLSTDSNWSDAKTLQTGSSPSIQTSPGQTNVIAVVAQGSSLQIFVNSQQIAAATDSTLTQGWPGMFAGNLTTNAVADFQDVRIWQF